MRHIGLTALKKMLDTGEASLAIEFFLNKDGAVDSLEFSIVPDKKKEKKKRKRNNASY